MVVGSLRHAPVNGMLYQLTSQAIWIDAASIHGRCWGRNAIGTDVGSMARVLVQFTRKRLTLLYIAA